jgi:hypothetical protein
MNSLTLSTAMSIGRNSSRRGGHAVQPQPAKRGPHLMSNGPGVQGRTSAAGEPGHASRVEAAQHGLRLRGPAAGVFPAAPPDPVEVPRPDGRAAVPGVVVQEVARHQDRDRRQDVGEADEQPGPGQERRHGVDPDEVPGQAMPFGQAMLYTARFAGLALAVNLAALLLLLVPPPPGSRPAAGCRRGRRTARPRPGTTPRR